ncbi:hypothetical protein BHE74_00047704 [Ensete ventricosum]|nr:hypothetical protein BHE74_00047704 [Ensete ventricosum]
MIACNWALSAWLWRGKKARSVEKEEEREDIRRRGRIKRTIMHTDSALSSLDDPNPGGNSEVAARAAEEAVSFIASFMILRLFICCVLHEEMETAFFSSFEPMRQRGRGDYQPREKEEEGEVKGELRDPALLSLDDPDLSLPSLAGCCNEMSPPPCLR